MDGIAAELLIVNDCPEQTLICNIPNVRILQGMPQFARVVEKYNHAFKEARGKWLIIWDDDDISLPFHIATLMKYAATKPGCVMVRPKKMWHMENSTIRGWGMANLCNGMCLASAVAQLGGAVVTEWVDRSLAYALPKIGAVVDFAPTENEISYIYRWGGIGYHDSGDNVPDPAERSRKFREVVLADKRFRTGDVRVFPAWSIDFEAEARLAINSGLANKRV